MVCRDRTLTSWWSGRAPRAAHHGVSRDKLRDTASTRVKGGGRQQCMEASMRVPLRSRAAPMTDGFVAPNSKRPSTAVGRQAAFDFKASLPDSGHRVRRGQLPRPPSTRVDALTPSTVLSHRYSRPRGRRSIPNGGAKKGKASRNAVGQPELPPMTTIFMTHERCHESLRFSRVAPVNYALPA
jgi:hypothetical protein